MKLLAPLLFSVALLLTGVQAGEQVGDANPVALSPEMVTIPSETTAVPEPSSTFFAGIGGLALLFFVLRRRTASVS